MRVLLVPGVGAYGAAHRYSARGSAQPPLGTRKQPISGCNSGHFGVKGGDMGGFSAAPWGLGTAGVQRWGQRGQFRDSRRASLLAHAAPSRDLIFDAIGGGIPPRLPTMMRYPQGTSSLSWRSCRLPSLARYRMRATTC